MPLALRGLLPAAALVVVIVLLAVLLLSALPGGGGVWSELTIEIQAIQRDLHRQLAAAMRAVQERGAAAAWTLVLLSFLYGVFHAAGPGHGKVVISTYLLTQESALRRGLLLSTVSSLCQGLTAVLAVEVTAGLLDLTLRQAQGTAANLESLSYGLVALLGLVLAASRLRRLGGRLRRGREGHAQDAEGHGHGGEDCGHAHGPRPQDLEAPLSWRGFAAMVASIGIRPCSGAILVLLVAYSLELRWAGIAAVLAMSLGTAITVSLLATLSVYARKGSLRLAALLPGQSGRLSLALDLVAVAGGLLILAAGLLLLQASWTLADHPLR
ncbi:MAG: nickel/cobalt transporter [Rhodovibrionaceae bacterium]